MTTVNYHLTPVKGVFSSDALTMRERSPLGRAIRRFRQDAGLTVTAVAKQLGISRQGYTPYEAMGSVSAARLSEIAQILGTTPSEIMAFSEGPSLPSSSPVETRQLSSDHLHQPARSRLPIKAYARVSRYLERLRKAGIPEEMIDECERLMAVPVFSKLNKRDVRERSEEDLITDIDAAWAWIREVIQREWGISL